MSDILSISLQDILYRRQSKLRKSKIVMFLKQRYVSLLIIRYIERKEWVRGTLL